LNFIFGLVCLFVCVCAFSLRRESPDMILGDKPLISEVVLSQSSSFLLNGELGKWILHCRGVRQGGPPIPHVVPADHGAFT
jgi:hypothetical protein